MMVEMTTGGCLYGSKFRRTYFTWGEHNLNDKGAWGNSPLAFEIYTGVSNTEGFGVAMVIFVLFHLYVGSEYIFRANK